MINDAGVSVVLLILHIAITVIIRRKLGDNDERQVVIAQIRVRELKSLYKN